MRFCSTRPAGAIGILALNLLVAACGTQVGNGRSKPTPPSATGDKANTASDGNSPGDTDNTDTSTNTDSGTTETTSARTLTHLFIPCGSPLAEISAGTYEADADNILVVSSKSANLNHFVLGTTTGDYSYGVSGLTAYEISLTPATLAEGRTCASVTSATSGGSQIRTAVYDDGYKTVWTVDGSGVVQSIQVITAQGQTDKTWTLQP